jgi:hypothetical protein
MTISDLVASKKNGDKTKMAYPRMTHFIKEF